jgi:hypothetical protein
MVLWEAREKDESGKMKDEKIHLSSFILHPSIWSGYSDNYIRVVAASGADLTNQFTAARVVDVAEDGVTAEL